MVLELKLDTLRDGVGKGKNALLVEKKLVPKYSGKVAIPKSMVEKSTPMISLGIQAVLLTLCLHKIGSVEFGKRYLPLLLSHNAIKSFLLLGFTGINPAII
ncbi:hypothetical protein [Flavobacterium sp. PS2]|uniref:hypothetical protein n=1 Tax=Flavobacterium sp. PS2 TaxID=3384157 RepID=UPI00390C6E9E